MEDDVLDYVPQHLLCPVCFLIPKAKVFQCKAGHILCETCYSTPRISKCPQCRETINKRIPIRSLATEQTLEALKLKCPNQGCTAALNRLTFSKHIEECRFKIPRPLTQRQLPPPLLVLCEELKHFLQDEGKGCQFTIISGNKTQVLHHLRTDHNVFIARPEGLISQPLVKKILFSPTPRKQIIIINRESEGHAIFFFLSTSGQKDLIWASYFLFYDKEGAEAGKWKNTSYISEIKLIKLEGGGKKKELYRAILMPRDILKIRQYPIKNYSNLLHISPHLERNQALDISKLRLIFNVRKR